MANESQESEPVLQQLTSMDILAISSAAIRGDMDDDVDGIKINADGSGWHQVSNEGIVTSNDHLYQACGEVIQTSNELIYHPSRPEMQVNNGRLCEATNQEIQTAHVHIQHSSSQQIQTARVHIQHSPSKEIKGPNIRLVKTQVGTTPAETPTLYVAVSTSSTPDLCPATDLLNPTPSLHTASPSLPKRPKRARTRSPAVQVPAEEGRLPFGCDLCPEAYAERLSLAAHQRRHGDAALSCADCPRVFTEPLSLRRHRRMHAVRARRASGRGKRRSRPPSRFVDWWESRAARRAPSEPSESVVCGVCDAQLQPGEVRAHLAAAAGSGFYRCSSCGCVFGQRCQLARHGCRGTEPRRRSKRRRVTPPTPTPRELDTPSDGGEDDTEDSNWTPSGRDMAADPDDPDDPVDSNDRVDSSDPAEPTSDSGGLTCDVCQMTFVSRRNLTRHRSQHTGGSRYSCETCEASYARLDDLTRHSIDVHRQKRQYRCPRCVRCFTQPRIVQYHVSLHRDDKPHLQPAGGLTSPAAPTAAEPGSVAAAAGMPVRYLCSPCGVGFDTRRRYLRHQQVRHDQSSPRYTCELCPLSYGRIDELTRHTIHVHGQQRTHKCPRCSRYFTQQRIVDYHVSGHNTKRVYLKAPRPHSCRQCKRSFATADQLAAHGCRVTRQTQRCVCDICGRSISCPQALRRHRLQHSDERPAKCQVCGMAFIDDVALSKHALTHSDEKPYLCDHCGKGFRFKDYLLRHTRFHTGERPYKCGECEKSFATSDTLNRHFLIHTGEKPFVCTVCSRPFRQSQQLKTHMRVHQKKSDMQVMVLQQPEPPAVMIEGVVIDVVM